MTALIIARPGRLRDGLSALLSTMPEFKMVAVTADLESALVSIPGRCPAVILLHIPILDPRALAQFQELRAVCSQTKIIVLVEEPTEIRGRDIDAVDAILTRGVRPSKLTETLSGLLAA